MGRNKTLWLILLPSVTALIFSSSRTLNTVEELADGSIEFVKTFPHHGLLLLHWLAMTLQFKQTPHDSIQLVNIEPSFGDYGFYRYYIQGISLFSGNPLSSSLNGLQQYYSLGNLDANLNPRCSQLPKYVTEDFYNSNNHRNKNRNRIVVQISRNIRGQVSRVPLTELLRVFITQSL